MESFSLPLPESYSTSEVLSFHGRDREGFSETVTEGQIRKGLVLEGVPLVLTIDLHPGEARFHIAAEGKSPSKSTVIGIAKNLLGLNIDPATFFDFVGEDPLMGPLVRRKPQLRIPQAATVFEALTWAVIGQQINLPFAITLRRNFIRMAGLPHRDGLWCYPEAAAVAGIEPEDLTPYQFSRSKAETLVRVARMIDSGELRLDGLKAKTQAEIEAALLAVKGIGPWTVNYTLLRGFALEDCSLDGDAGIRNAIHRLTGSDIKPTAAEIQLFLANYQPHRTMAAAHLWASL
jgi:DNA-3-methyladenine glycosylase II